MKFDRDAGVYREDDGAIVPRAKVLAELEKASMGLERRLEESMSKLVVSELARTANPQKWERSRNKYTIADFQKEAKQLIKDTTMQMALLGAGGRESADARIYGTAGAQLKKNYQALSRLGEQLANGELTTAQAIDRARRASGGTRQAFHRAEQIQRARDGFTEGWRRLAPGFRHCFIAGTKVESENGSVNIEDLLPGDNVLTRDGFQEIEECYAVPFSGELLEISVNGHKVICTPNHPFWTQRGWIEAQYLELTDYLMTL